MRGVNTRNELFSEVVLTRGFRTAALIPAKRFVEYIHTYIIRGPIVATFRCAVSAPPRLNLRALGGGGRAAMRLVPPKPHTGWAVLVLFIGCVFRCRLWKTMHVGTVLLLPSSTPPSHTEASSASLAIFRRPSLVNTECLLYLVDLPRPCSKAYSSSSTTLEPLIAPHAHRSAL